MTRTVLIATSLALTQLSAVFATPNYKVNGVALGIRRSDVNAIFKAESKPKPSDGLLEHFGSQPGYHGLGDSTWIRFDKFGLVSLVVGANLLLDKSKVITEATPRPDARKFIQELGQPKREQRKIDGDLSNFDFYSKARLTVKSSVRHSEYPLLFFLGTVEEKDLLVFNTEHYAFCGCTPQVSNLLSRQNLASDSSDSGSRQKLLLYYQFFTPSTIDRTLGE